MCFNSHMCYMCVYYVCVDTLIFCTSEFLCGLFCCLLLIYILYCLFIKSVHSEIGVLKPPIVIVCL